MARTTVPEVRLELEADGYPTEALTDTQIETVGITPAALDVDERLVNTTMSEERLALIERYLAGHMILASGVDELRQADSEELSDESSVEYAGDREFADYRATSLGQKAIGLDTSGTLAQAHKPTASLSVPDVR
jgi:hypothetical protein